MICYSNNGLSMRMVDDDYVAQAGEVVFDAEPNDDELDEAFPGRTAAMHRSDVLQQIFALEAKQTPRRLREAALGQDAGWLANLNSQIVSLRSKL